MAVRGGRPPRARAPLPMALSSLGMVGGKGAAMALGFLFWLAAARRFGPRDVGLAAAAVSATMLCVQLALVGAGSAFIAEYPRRRDDPSGLLDATLGIVTTTAVAAAALFLAIAAGVTVELRDLVATPAFLVLFVAVTVLGTAGVALDHVSMALGRGDHVAVRNVANGVVTLVALALLPGVSAGAGALALFGVWITGAVAACALARVQVRGFLPGYRFRPVLGRRAVALVRIGLPNYVLTLADRMPGLVIPLLVTEILSAETNAYWYAVWMTAWAAYVVPLSFGTALFAEVSHRPDDVARSTRHAVRSCLVVGGIVAVAVAAGAEPVLTLLGPSYAAEGSVPLRLMVVAVVPLTFVQAWFAVCRARRRLGEAVATGAVTGAAAVAATAAAAAGGLTAMALAWTLTQAIAGAWCLARLRALVSAPAGEPVTMPAARMVAAP